MSRVIARKSVEPKPTTAELLQRALWVSGNVARLHEISFDLGVICHVAEVESVANLARAGQVIVDAAERLARDLSVCLTEREQPPAVLKLQQYRKGKA